MDTIRLGIIMNGVTGRMGTNQHLIRSICAIRAEGGVRLADGRRVMPDPILVGRNADKLKELARANGVTRWSTDLSTALANKDDTVYFDSASTGLRPKLINQAIAAGKHIYTEKPVAPTLREALDIYDAAKATGVKHGVVQDKLWLPGLLKMKMLVDSGFFGRILSVRGEFGYWVFEGDWQPAQRPSWNYRKEDDGGVIVDMLCHWRYVLDNLWGEVKSVSCLGTTHIPKRWESCENVEACPAVLGVLRPRVPAEEVHHGSPGPAERCGAHLAAWLAGNVLQPGARQHAEAGVEPRHPADDRFLFDVAKDAEQS